MPLIYARPQYGLGSWIFPNSKENYESLRFKDCHFLSSPSHGNSTKKKVRKVRESPKEKRLEWVITSFSLQGTVRRTAHSKPFVRCKTIAWSDQNTHHYLACSYSIFCNFKIFILQGSSHEKCINHLPKYSTQSALYAAYNEGFLNVSNIIISLCLLKVLGLLTMYEVFWN